MKTFVRIGLLTLALGSAGLLTGCASHRSSATASKRATGFEVVETSSKRLLSAQEMVQLRAAVANYLVKEGAIADGDYYVKVYLTPEQEGVPAEWVVVRFTRDSDVRFSLLASYPAYSTTHGSYAAYDYYPYGYDSFGRISFQYYDDPFYGTHYYFPPRSRHRNHGGDGDHGRRRNHDRDRDHDGDRDRRDDQAGSRDTPRFKPIPAVGSQPVTRPRREENSADRNSQARDNNNRYHGGGRSQDRRSESPQSSPVSAPARTESARSEPVRSYSAPAPRSESTYTASASRSESSSSSSSHQSQREANQAAAQRERLE
jgi:hypothetical protein